LARAFRSGLIILVLVFLISACSDQRQSGPSAKDYFDRAYGFVDAGIPQEAINLYTLAIEKDPMYIDAYYNRGIMHYILREYSKALADLNTVIEKKPDYAIAYASRGSAYDKTGDHKKALNDYIRAAQLGDKDTQDYLRSKGITW
jgi:tetratricopeptide (TPR) repeat protein